MLYLVYCRDRPGTAGLRAELTERHWAFMDDYAEAMIARGPTLTADREHATGSLHIVDLPGAEAAQRFAYEEPNHRAGVYADVLIRRYDDRLGRTMWEFPRTSGFLILATTPTAVVTVPPAESLIAYGHLLADDGTTRTGTAVLAEHPGVQDGDTEVHPWQFGGRR
ncbi:YciI family protein [Actinoplanes sp. NPDC051494]|uniref:YciI family protein n=1 Tax=Actinoplanes sp. NPDC051494 TaxID=3363907 RepID=UPI003788AEFE